MADEWRDIWEMANSHSPYRTFPMDRQRLVQHWNEVSKDYDSESMSLIDERIWGLLEDMSVLTGGGTALDIGCGTGSLTAMLASKCSSVLGLDISPGMLSVAKERCSGLRNVELLCQSWEEFSPGRRYDLVFSSFCPAVDDIRSVMRMDAMSDGTCCIVSLGGSSGDRLAFDIWEELGHPGISMEGFDPIFPYRILKEMDRQPSLRRFDVHEETEMAEKDMVSHLTRYFSLFHEVDGKIGKAIVENVRRKSDGGRFTLREDRTVSVLKWSPVH
ncbi:MAG: class I SAM-dependent methyltransferase [Methanomassiliicoccales archaeon]